MVYYQNIDHICLLLHFLLKKEQAKDYLRSYLFTTLVNTCQIIQEMLGCAYGSR
jgi:hypothetical protein